MLEPLGQAGAGGDPHGNTQELLIQEVLGTSTVGAGFQQRVMAQYPFSDFPACLLQCALKAKLAAEASLPSPKRQLEETSSKRLQAVALVHGLLVACRGTQVTSEPFSGSQPVSVPLGCCLCRQENRCPLGAGRFHRCAEPVPVVGTARAVETKQSLR